MNARQHSRLMNLNRVLIFVLTSGGLLMDGIQIADLPCTLALLVWLWLPLCTRLEAYLLHRINGMHCRSDRQEALLTHNTTTGASHYRSQP